MPEVNGTEAVLELSRTKETKNIKIIFFSNLLYPWPGIKEDKEKFSKELGAVTFMSKEDDLNKVIAKVRELSNKTPAAPKIIPPEKKTEKPPPTT